MPPTAVRRAMMDRRLLAAFVLSAAQTAVGGEQAVQHDGAAASWLSVSDVAKVANDDNWVLVDTRATDAYNGWKWEGMKRGGHLPGAVDFPASWLDSDHEDKAEILSMALRVKGIEPQRHILLYGTNKRDQDRVAAYLHEAGCRRIYHFDLNAWVEDSSKPLVRYKNFYLLVPAPIVKVLLDGQLPETFEGTKRIKFVEASWGGEDASYSKGHIPGSFHVNTDHFEPPPKWMLGSRDVLREFAAKYGFQSDDTVIISGENPTASYRLAVVLRYMGVEDVRVLNGGIKAWKAAKYPVEVKSRPPPQATNFGARIPRRPNLIDEITRVKTALRTPAKFTLVDTRTWAEFSGKSSGYKYHFHKGRIPGSVYGQGDFKGKNSLTPYRNIDDTMRNANEIQTLWKKSGIDTDKHLSFMCGSGWRAAEVLTIAHVMGLSNTSLYSDGWIGWSSDRRNAVETGPTTGDPVSR